MIKQFIKDESGQDIVEYSLLLVLIGAAAILILTTMGQSITKIFTTIKATLDKAEGEIGK
jgi:pilus assembly protein Flp/PilA